MKSTLVVNNVLKQYTSIIKDIKSMHIYSLKMFNAHRRENKRLVID